MINTGHNRGKSILNIPNTLSIIRIFFIVPFIIFIISERYVYAGLILLLSGLSDLLDGFLARKFNQLTKLGAMLDPAADKLTLIAVMVGVGVKFPEIVPFMMLLVIKEVSMLLASAFLLKKNICPSPAKWYGKIGTVAFYISVIIIVSLKAIFNVENIFLNIFLMSVTALLMLYALVKYFKIFVMSLSEKKTHKL